MSPGEIWIFATGNPNKVAEVHEILEGRIELRSLTDMRYYEELPEDHDTLEANAEQKARFVFELFDQPCFSEDTGLEVDALDGEPGVYSARYGGVHGDHRANIDKLLEKLQGHRNRSARFRTVFALMDAEGRLHTFEGICEGSIAMSPRGVGGFGYDPVFIPRGRDVTFAQMDPEEKNAMSHRRKALDKLLEFMLQLSGK